MATIEELLFYWQIIIVIICLVITILSIQKHISKGNPVTKSLMIMFIFFLGSLIFQTLGTYSSYINEWNHGSPLFGQPDWFLNLLIFLVKGMQISQFFVILGIFMLNIFSMKIFASKPNPIIYALHIVYIIMVFLIFFALRPVFGLLEFELINIAYFLMIYAIIVMIPILIQCIRLISKLDKSEAIRNNVKYLGLMSGLIILTFIFFALETLFGMGVNTFSFLAWATLLFTLISAYLSFFKSQKS